jgi:hypothetical protein
MTQRLHILGKDIGVAKDNHYQDFVDFLIRIAEATEVSIGTLKIEDKYVLCIFLEPGLEMSFIDELFGRIAGNGIPFIKDTKPELVYNELLDPCLIWRNIEIMPLLN